MQGHAFSLHGNGSLALAIEAVTNLDHTEISTKYLPSSRQPEPQSRVCLLEHTYDAQLQIRGDTV
jgi:hypothetical protein